MNGTGVVGYIALLMICGSILGGDGQVNFGAIRADALSSTSISQATKQPLSVSVMSRGPKGERYVRIFIDGIPYEGTLHANGTDINSKQ